MEVNAQLKFLHINQYLVKHHKKPYLLTILTWDTAKNMLFKVPSFKNSEVYEVKFENDECFVTLLGYHLRLTIPRKKPLIIIPMRNGG